MGATALCGIQRNEFADARAKTLLSNCRASDMRKVPMLYSTAVVYYKEQNRQYYHNQFTTEQTERSAITFVSRTGLPERSRLPWHSFVRAPVPLWAGMSDTVGTDMIPITRTTYADVVA